MSDTTRKHEIEVDIRATPEEVWEAITEGEKLQQWFAPIAKVEPGKWVELGWSPEMCGKANVRTWEPGKCMSWVEGEGSEREKVVEFRVEAKDESTTTLRMVHSGFGAGAEFDNEYDSTHGGWHTFFASLRHGLERFANKPAKMASVFRMAGESKAVVWERCKAELAIDTTTEGASYTAKLGSYDLAGEVLRAPREGYLCLRVDTLDDSVLSIFVEGGNKAMVTVQWTLYGDAVQVAPAAERAIVSFVEQLTDTGSSAGQA